MKGLLCVAAAVLAVSVVSGPAAYAMNVPVLAAEDESGSSLDEILDDLENSTPAELNYANPMGYWAGMTYVNENMGISLTLPDSFEILETQNDSQVSYLVAAADSQAQEFFQLVSVDLTVSDDEDLTEQECLELMGESLVSSAGLSVSNEAFSTATLGGQDWTQMSVDISSEDGAGGQARCYCLKDVSTAYIATVISFEGGNTGIQAILDSITPLEQGVWNGNVYMNEGMGISMTIPERFAITKNDSSLADAGLIFYAMAQDTGETIQMFSISTEDGVPEDYDEEDLLNDVLSGMTESDEYTLGEEKFSDVEICGTDYTLMTVTASYGEGADIGFNYYGRLTDDMAYVLVCTGLDSQALADEVIQAAIPCESGSFYGETYLNTSIGIGFTLPETWDVLSGYTQESGYDQAFMAGDADSGESIQLQVYDLEELGLSDLTEEVYGQQIMEIYEDQGLDAEDTIGSIAIGSAPYSVVTATGNIEGWAVKMNICYRIQDDHLYVFFFTCDQAKQTEGYSDMLAQMGITGEM